MNLAPHNGPVVQREERHATPRPMEAGLLIHTKCTNTQNTRCLGQYGGQLFTNVDFPKAEPHAFFSIYLTIGGMETRCPFVWNNIRSAARYVSLWNEVIPATGVSNPENATVTETRSSHMAAVTRYHLLNGLRPLKRHNLGNLMC
jgi:hypothetical protein